MDLAFIITAHYPGGHPETTIVYSPDVAVMSLAAHLRRTAHCDTSYADAVNDAELAVGAVARSIGAGVEWQRGDVRVSIIRSLLTGV